MLGKGYTQEGQQVGCYIAGGVMKHWGDLGAFWNEYWAMLRGAGFFWIPEMGPVLAAGPIVESIARPAHPEAAGATPIGAGISSVGVPADKSAWYEGEIRAGKFVLMAAGAVEEIGVARDLLAGTQAMDLAVFSTEVPPAAGASHFFG